MGVYPYAPQLMRRGRGGNGTREKRRQRQLACGLESDILRGLWEQRMRLLWKPFPHHTNHFSPTSDEVEGRKQRHWGCSLCSPMAISGLCSE
ncbi:hypothetical protein NPIL_395061 [Nephila pilipes]|uniref:Uncharacterized protein n=1 Tax=Nephila pilipes TaxID=299642 RepID=A0A8X6TEA4_NEPPI|nr:hypothetical protein NPIL_395061 [Nephila pilipes]